MLPKSVRLLACRAKLTACAVGLGIFATAAAAQQPVKADCKNDPGITWPLNANDPQPADEIAIRKLLTRYNWALDDHSPLQLENLFADKIFYELCNAAGDQLMTASDSGKLKSYLGIYFDVFDDSGTQPRHIESNTLLNMVDANTVQGKSTVVVTLQHSDIETPVLDYTGELRTVFKKDGNIWQFTEITLITDGPRLQARAR
jgi:hypothetical protein